ncbi:MAG TPA: DegQ family serine endoprotease, partial [Gammaproteobacteria bacterium]|nr:DegQ family serine endoprotease [Gammaproteobacteria bacterium]
MSETAKRFMKSASALSLAAFMAAAGFSHGALAQVRVAGGADEASQPSQTQQGRKVLDQVSAAFEQAAATVNPAVVPIFSEAKVAVQSPFGDSNDPLRQFFGDQFFQRFFGDEGGGERTVHALGSGVIASSDGYILTNNHVVENATMLTVVLPDGSRKQAKTIGNDPQSDLALIKVDAENLPAATFGDSDEVKVGQWVIAVGNPFELLHTTTAGIISAKGRSSVGITNYEDFIQTDAAINPGNSGGALADLDGRVIGINSAISTPTGGNVGLGFAIPINMAMNVMQQLKEHGKVVRGYLGVVLQPLTPELQKALGLKSAMGVLIGDVAEGSPAERGGVQRGDVVTEFNGKPVTEVTELRNMVAALTPGTKAQIGVERNGRHQTLEVTLGEQPQEAQASSAAPGEQGGPENPARLGLAVEDLTPELAQQLGVQQTQGAVVASVQPGSAAEEAGLQRGDIIEEVNRQKIRSAEDLVGIVRSLKSG